MRRLNNLTTDISGILNIPPTGRDILSILMKSKRGLSASEIISRSKKSERAIRAHLKSLHDLRLIRREKAAARKGRPAHLYFALRTHELVRSAKKEILQRLRRLEARVGVR